MGWHPLLRVQRRTTFRPLGQRRRQRADTFVPGPGHAWVGTGTAFKDRADRAVLTFATTVAIIRFGSKRLFGKGTAFDYIVAIMIGSIMSRAISESSPLFPTWVAGAVLVALHWLLAWLTSRVEWFGPLVKGNPVELIRDGEVLEDGMREAALSKNDLDQALREQGVSGPSGIRRAVLERDGTISILKTDSEPRIVEIAIADGVQTVRVSLS